MTLNIHDTKSETSSLTSLSAHRTGRLCHGTMYIVHVAPMFRNSLRLALHLCSWKTQEKADLFFWASTHRTNKTKLIEDLEGVVWISPHCPCHFLLAVGPFTMKGKQQRHSKTSVSSDLKVSGQRMTSFCTMAAGCDTK